ncbi:hypothetical protein [Bradyrhizobium elkanii]|uniref:hypothetical protein n=1 Tax=Bradyrhizobium elkanii TaxID=29448 RepID=UPI002169C914|nr:hypothetical protein [Bradyrhizobium elkanii]MCS3690931.1 hypothetical protein [Bradyrhizobium elkanii]
MSAEIIAFPQARAKTVRPVFPSITGSMTIERHQMFNNLADRIFSEAFPLDTAPSEVLHTDNDGAA